MELALIYTARWKLSFFGFISIYYVAMKIQSV